MEQYPRLLIISHNLYDETNNIGKTLVSLLSNWPQDKLAQVYFRNDIPSFKKCKNYYCITDKDVALSIISFGLHKAGKILSDDKIANLSGAEKDLYRVGNKRIPFVSLVRDTMWGIGTWKNSRFKQWLKDFDPEIILFVPNDYLLAFDVALYIEKSVKTVPLVPYYMDDAFYYDCNISGFDRFRRMKIRKKASLVHSYANKIFTICKKMSLKYEKQFGMECSDFMNSIKPQNFEAKVSSTNRTVFSYIGNLHSNRWRCLVEIGEALQNTIDETKQSVDAQLYIYSASNLGERELSILNAIPCINFMGSIPPSDVQKKQREADVLLHVEAFDKKSKNSTMYSLSTKIPEYLNVGVCVFAYGPSDIASIEYLHDNDVAFVCTDKNLLNSTLINLLNDDEKRLYFEKRGLDIAKEHHDIQKVSTSFVLEILNLYRGWTR